MSLIKHARRIAEKAKAVADDLDAIHPADDANTTYVQVSLRGHRPARDVLPTAALLEALGPAGLRRLQSPAGLGLIVQVPGPDWVPHIELALRGITSFAHIFARNGSSKTQDRHPLRRARSARRRRRLRRTPRRGPKAA